MTLTPSLANLFEYDDPRDPIYSPVKWNPAHSHPDSTLRLHLCYQNICHWHDRCKQNKRAMNLSSDTSFIWCERQHWHWHFRTAPYHRFQFNLDPPIQFESDLPIQFNPRHMRIIFELSHSWFTPHGFSYRPECPEINQTAESKNNPGFLKLKLVFWGHSNFLEEDKIEGRVRKKTFPCYPLSILGRNLRIRKIGSSDYWRTVSDQ